MDPFHKCRWHICYSFVFHMLIRPTVPRPHFGLDIVLNFGHGMEVRNEGLLALKQKNIKFDRHYESGLYCMEAVTPLKCATKVCDFSQ